MAVTLLSRICLWFISILVISWACLSPAIAYSDKVEQETPQQTYREKEPSAFPGRNYPKFVPDELLVQHRTGVSETKARKLFRGFGAAIIDYMPQIRTHLIRVPVQALAKVQAALARRPEFQSVERNQIHAPIMSPNDPYYIKQWHLPQIFAPSAWDLAQGVGVTIAILDSGIDPTHPDLCSKMVPGYNFYDNNTDTADVYGHGTKVAGVAAAVSNNDQGVASVACEAFLMPLRVTGNDGYAYTSTLSKGLIWAADHGARVMNMSFSSVAGISTITSAAQYARNQGSVVVAAAGNSGCYDSTPENPYMISVSATDSAYNLASFSSRGEYVDLAAPGVDIYTTVMGGGYDSVSGTSFSSPVVAGVVALIMSANPSLAPAEVEQILLATADDLGDAGKDTSYGHGLVNSYQAVLAASGTPALPLDITPPTVAIASPLNDAQVTGTITVSISAADNVGISNVALYLNGALFAADSIAPYIFTCDTTKNADGAYTLSAVACDAAGNQATSAPVNITVANALPDATPPTVAITSPANGDEITKVVKVAIEVQENSLVSAVDFLVDGGVCASSACNASAVSLRFNWNTRKDGTGSHTLTAVARDAAGNQSVSAPVVVVVK
jgi:thermitase